MKLRVIYDEISFNSRNNRQIKVTKDQNHILLQTGKNEIGVLGSLASNVISFVSVIGKVPGDEIVAFESFTEDKVVCLSNNGYLSCFKLANENSEMITVKKINLLENEIICSLSSNSQFNKIAVTTLQGSKVVARVFEYDFIDNFFALKFDKSLDNLELAARDSLIDGVLTETILFEKQILRGDPVFAFSGGDSDSSKIAFYGVNELGIRPITSLDVTSYISLYKILNDRLWILTENGTLKLYQ